MQETWVPSLSQEDPLEKEMTTHSSLGNPMDRGAWRATVHGVASVRYNLTTKQHQVRHPFYGEKYIDF